MPFSKEMLMKAYRAMYMSRQYENKVNAMFKDKQCKEKPLSGIGQEATGVGVAAQIICKNRYELFAKRACINIYSAN